MSFRTLTVRTPEKRAAFLTKLADGDSVTAACKAAGMSRVTAYEWRNTDEQFKKDWDDALEAGTDTLEDVAKKRAKRQSDTLLIFLLKARRPDKYKDRVSNEHHGPNGGPIQTQDVSALDDLTSRMDRLAARTAPTSARRDH
jgi:hypothetical protein